MQNSKFWAAACSAILCVSMTCSGAEDNAAQRKAREALENQTGVGRSQTAPPAPAGAQPEVTTPPPQTPATRPAPPKKPRKEKPAPKPRPQPAPAVAPSADSAPLSRPLATPSQPVTPAPPMQPAAPAHADSETIAKAREAMRQKLSEEQAKNPPPVVTHEPVSKPPRAVPDRPVKVARPEPAPSAEVVNRNPPPAPRKTKKKTETPNSFEPIPDRTTASPANTPPPDVAATTTTPPVNHEPAPQPPKKPKKQPKSEKVDLRKSEGYKPLEGPPSTLSATKQEKLDELLRRYRADEVTPEQYHSERAKILSEP